VFLFFCYLALLATTQMWC